MITSLRARHRRVQHLELLLEQRVALAVERPRPRLGPSVAAHAASSSVASPPDTAVVPLPSQPVTTRHVRSSAGESLEEVEDEDVVELQPFASKIVNTSALAKAAGSRSFDACERTSTAWWAPNSI